MSDTWSDPTPDLCAADLLHRSSDKKGILHSQFTGALLLCPQVAAANYRALQPPAPPALRTAEGLLGLPHRQRQNQHLMNRTAPPALCAAKLVPGLAVLPPLAIQVERQLRSAPLLSYGGLHLLFEGSHLGPHAAQLCLGRAPQGVLVPQPA